MTQQQTQPEAPARTWAHHTINNIFPARFDAAHCVLDVTIQIPDMQEVVSYDFGKPDPENNNKRPKYIAQMVPGPGRTRLYNVVIIQGKNGKFIGDQHKIPQEIADEIVLHAEIATDNKRRVARDKNKA